MHRGSGFHGPVVLAVPGRASQLRKGFPYRDIEQLFAALADNPLGLGIDVGVAPLAVHREEPVGDALEYHAQALAS